MNDEIRMKEVLMRKRRRKYAVYAGRIIIGLLFLTMWQLCAQKEVINPFIFSSPQRVIDTISGFAREGVLWEHIFATLSETAVSFILTMLISLLAALLFWRFGMLYRLCEPYLILLNSLPKSALAPLLIVWLGNKPGTIIVVAVSLAVFNGTLSLYHAFTETDAEKIKLIRILNGNRIHVVTKILLPSTIPAFINNMKVNIGLCLVGVIIGEFLAARRGLGYLIIYGSQVFKMDYVVASILILCVIALGLYLLLNYMQKAYNKYYLKNASTK